MYTANNQLSFVVYTMADPGSIFLFKAASTIIVATLQRLILGKTFTLEQWGAMILQAFGMVAVQYNPSNSGMRYAGTAYVLMGLGTMVTATCSVRNEYLVKNYKIALNVQNAVLYFGGFVMNIIAFAIIARTENKQAQIGFFEGYSNIYAIGVVFSNAIIGLAITAVYKYADAVIKCIASDVTAVLLCVISSTFFELKPTPGMWGGVFVVLFAVRMYSNAAARSAVPPAQAQTATKVHEAKSDAKSKSE